MHLLHLSVAQSKLNEVAGLGAIEWVAAAVPRFQPQRARRGRMVPAAIVKYRVYCRLHIIRDDMARFLLLAGLLVAALGAAAGQEGESSGLRPQRWTDESCQPPVDRDLRLSTSRRAKTPTTPRSPLALLQKSAAQKRYGTGQRCARCFRASAILQQTTQSRRFPPTARRAAGLTFSFQPPDRPLSTLLQPVEVPDEDAATRIVYSESPVEFAGVRWGRQRAAASLAAAAAGPSGGTVWSLPCSCGLATASRAPQRAAEVLRPAQPCAP